MITAFKDFMLTICLDLYITSCTSAEWSGCDVTEIKLLTNYNL